MGLPRDEGKVPLLCVLEPFLAGNQLIVTPIVVLVTDLTLEPVLNSPEVASVFSHPLHSFLHKTPPFTSSTIRPDATNASYDDISAPYYSFTDINWADSGHQVRMHRFLTGKEDEGVKPVFGLTAAIMIRTAEIGYGHPPSFAVQAPGQLTQAERIERAMKEHHLLQQAAREEGLDEWSSSTEGKAKPRTRL